MREIKRNSAATVLSAKTRLAFAPSAPTIRATHGSFPGARVGLDENRAGRSAVVVPGRLRKRVRVFASGAPDSLRGRKALVIGGTRFSGLYLVHELLRRGAHVTLFNRGSKAIGDPALMVPGESEDEFAARNASTSQITGDRSKPESLKDALGPHIHEFDVVFDNNGREVGDSAPLVDMLTPGKTHYVYMSSAGVYAKAETMPHIEGDPEDHASRHKGKLNTEDYLHASGVSYTAIRPTYIYGAGNYNPIEEWFFERLDQSRPICIPGHGKHLTGLGHVRDLAAAMAAVAAKPEVSVGQIYNIQDRRAVTFDGVADMCAKVMGKGSADVVHYNPKSFDFGKKKAFPFRPQHFFCSPSKALKELDWSIEYDIFRGLADAYENDFLLKKARGGLKTNFEPDDMIIKTL
jgi:nucleoside-diphosphate-sugar epimerase